MKKFLIITLACVASLNLMAQGRVSFGNVNAGAGINALVRENGVVGPDGSTGTHGTVQGAGTLVNNTYRANLYWSPVATDVLGTGFISVTNAPATFVSPGSLANSTKTFGLAGGTQIFVQMRAWRLADGATYEAAALAGGLVGFSNVVPVTLTVSPTAAAPMVGLLAFDVGQVPEPSTIALGAFGLLAAWMIRRRK